jgi:23S rRNA (uracil1939-C5)-methyltransferase
MKSTSGLFHLREDFKISSDRRDARAPNNIRSEAGRRCHNLCSNGRLELKVEKLIYGGDGLARLPSTEPERAGKAVFIPFTIPGELVQAKIIEQKPGFARARPENILAAAPDRAQPPCPYFGDCGGCQYQHMTYDAQLRAKAEILRETLQRTAKLTPPAVVTHASPPLNYRNRTRMHVQAEREFAIGYHRFASHTLLPVRECPISAPLINRTLAAIWKLGEAGRVPRQVIEIEYFVNSEDNAVLLEVTAAADKFKPNVWKLMEFVNALRTEVPECIGVVLFAQSGKSQTRIDLTPAQQLSFGRDSLLYRTRGVQYQVSAGSFFQTNRFLIDTMVALATDGFSGDFALDLYAGAGLFTLPLSQNFREVAAVEVAPFSYHDLHANSPSNTKGYRVLVEEFLANLAKDKPRLDYVVVDPPRGGMGEAVSKLLGEFAAPRITYVSCDPATLARDLKVLAAAGYGLTALHLLDMFPQTFHIETVAQLAL